jgi:hypothetical protein
MLIMMVKTRYDMVSTREVVKRSVANGSLRRCAAAPSPTERRRSRVNMNS